MRRMMLPQAPVALRPRSNPAVLALRLLAFAAGILLLAAAWVTGARSGYERGAFEAGRTGYLDGYHAAATDQRARCRPWFSNQRLERLRGGPAICKGVF